MVFSGAARRASRDYLRRVLGRTPRCRERFRHYHCFAATILDRVFLYSGRAAHVRCEFEGLEMLRRHIATGRGCLLFGAHFGSFDILRTIALAESPVPLHVLMHARHARKMTRVMRRLNQHLPAQVIPLGRAQTMLDVRAALRAGDIVALLADRSLRGDRQVACDFLGANAAFPRGPFELAAMLDAPVVLFCATYHGDGRYAIRFEMMQAMPDDAAVRDAAIDERCRRYAAWLEARCREAPWNWFNFYDFWAAPGRAPARPDRFRRAMGG